MAKLEQLFMSDADLVALGLWLISTGEQANGKGLMLWALRCGRGKEAQDREHFEWCLPSGAKIFPNSWHTRKKGRWIVSGYERVRAENGVVPLELDVQPYRQFGKIVRQQRGY